MKVTSNTKDWVPVKSAATLYSIWHFCFDGINHYQEDVQVYMGGSLSAMYHTQSLIRIRESSFTFTAIEI